MAKLFAQVRFIACALALALIVAVATPAPVSAQGGPPAVSEQQLMQQLQGGAISGRVSIPDRKSATLIQPAGRDWRKFQTGTMKWIGGIAILGMLALLVIFYLWRGPIKIEGGRSGRKIVRFTGFERFVHWLTASTFVVLAITGLNIAFGRSLLLPLIGPEAFAFWSEWAKYAHNYLSFAFTIGVVLMFIMWIGQNFPTAADMEWLKKGGGMFSKTSPHVPAWKFNAGQKLLYWFVVLGGAIMVMSGYILMFPFYYGLDVGNMELAQMFHGVVGVLFVAIIAAHIYIGTAGTEGAFESMSEGTVDANWAKTHHPLWVEEETGRGAGRPRTQPAE
jgi:formate dehydrogenase subunit gamma